MFTFGMLAALQCEPNVTIAIIDIANNILKMYWRVYYIEASKRKKNWISSAAIVLTTKKLSIIITDKIISVSNYDIYNDSKGAYLYFKFNFCCLIFQIRKQAG